MVVTMEKMVIITHCNQILSRFQWPRGLRRRSTAARLLKLWVRISPGAWMSVCFECCVLSGRGLCDELITRPEESYQVWCVVMCDLHVETSWMRRAWPTGRCWAKKIQVVKTEEIKILISSKIWLHNNCSVLGTPVFICCSRHSVCL